MSKHTLNKIREYIEDNKIGDALLMLKRICEELNSAFSEDVSVLLNWFAKTLTSSENALFNSSQIRFNISNASPILLSSIYSLILFNVCFDIFAFIQ